MVLGPLQAKSTVRLDFNLQDINLILWIVPGETLGGQDVKAGQMPQGASFGLISACDPSLSFFQTESTTGASPRAPQQRSGTHPGPELALGNGSHCAAEMEVRIWQCWRRTEKPGAAAWTSPPSAVYASLRSPC